MGILQSLQLLHQDNVVFTFLTFHCLLSFLTEK
jgi:hypothetical protein